MRLWSCVQDALNGGHSCLTDTDGAANFTGPELLHLASDPRIESGG